MITGLADEVQVTSTERGLSVRMSWPAVARRQLADPTLPGAQAWGAYRYCHGLIAPL